MGRENDSNGKQDRSKKPSFFESLFSRQERDQDYMPELKDQWQVMDGIDRLKFVIGGLIGLALFIGALVLVYFLLAAIAG